MDAKEKRLLARVGFFVLIAVILNIRISYSTWWQGFIALAVQWFLAGIIFFSEFDLKKK